MSYALINIAGSDTRTEYRPPCQKPSPYVKTEAFTVLPPLSPQIPGPPPTPTPYRILPPIVSRKRPSFVILQEFGSRPVSREPSPSGRVSPFRGYGFKPPSREISPARQQAQDEKSRPSRSRLPVAQQKPLAARQFSKSVSPVRSKVSAIPRPMMTNRTTSRSNLDVVAQSCAPLKSSENLRCRRPVSEYDVRKSACKPPLPYKSSLKRSPVRNKLPESPVKSTPASPTKKFPQSPKKNDVDAKKTMTAATTTIRMAGRTMSKSPARCKENLSPCRRLPPTTTKPPPASRTSPSKTKVSPKKSPAKPAPAKPIEVVTKCTDAVEEQPKKCCEKQTTTATTNDKPAASMPKTIARKALTSSNLLNSLKKTTTKEDEIAPVKKEIAHSDTSKSLPISIVAANMTDSSLTVVRATTEPVVAPIEPELINGIRSAFNDATKMAEDEISLKQDAKPDSNSVKSNAGIAPIAEMEEIGSTGSLDKSEPSLSKPIANVAEPVPTPVEVVAKIEESKPEMTSTEISIKQDAEGDVYDSNASSTRENRNGSSKSPWLNEKRPNEEPTMRAPVQKKMQEKPSSECLMPTASAKQSPWSRLRSKCSKCMRKSEPHAIQITTITNGSDPARVPRHESSCVGKYFCCFCYKCKLKNDQNDRSSTDDDCDKNKSRCGRFSDNCKSVFGRVSSCGAKTKRGCKSNKIDASTKTTTSTGDESISKSHRQGALLKCLGVLCCVNSSICTGLRTKCGNLCACFRKCACCGNGDQKITVTESERRISTVSMVRKRKWTRVLTDFPKLDSSFVEHGSIMRGAIPVLPVPLAWICLILNVFLPGFGTLFSGIFCIFVGKPRFSINDSILSRIGAFLVNLLVAGSQLFTVLFCLVGWGWSVWWGVMIMKMAKKNKRIVLAEQGGNIPHSTPKPNRNADLEQGIVT